MENRSPLAVQAKRIVYLALTVGVTIVLTDLVGRGIITAEGLVVRLLSDDAPVPDMDRPWPEVPRFERPFPSPQRPTRWWEENVSGLQDDPRPLARTLTIGLEENRIAARYDLEVPMDHPLAVALRSGIGLDRSLELVGELLGPVSVGLLDRGELSFSGVLLEPDPAAGSLHLWLTSLPDESRHRSDLNVMAHAPDPGGLSFEPDRVIVKHPAEFEARLCQGNVTVVVQRDETGLVLSRIDPNYTRCAVNFVRKGAPPKPPTTMLSLIERLELNPLVLGSLLFALLEGLPFLIFLRVMRGDGAGDEAFGGLRRIVSLLLVFHFGLYALESLRQIPWALGRLWPEPYRWIQVLPSGGFGWVAVAVLLAGAVWPAYTRRQQATRAEGPAAARTHFLQLGAIVLIGTGLGLLLYGQKELSFAWLLGVWTAGAFVLLVWAVALMLAVILPEGRLRGRTLLASLVLVLIPAVLILSWHPEYYTWPVVSGHWIRLALLLPPAVFLLAAVPFLFSLIDVSHAAFCGGPLSERRSVWAGWQRWALLLVVVWVAFPSRWLAGESPRLASPEDILPLAYTLDNLIVYPFLWILLEILRRESASQPGAELTPAARWSGVLLALTFFFSPTIRWLYIPIVFLVGYFLLTRWLIRRNPEFEKVVDAIHSQRREIIGARVALGYAQKALGKLKSSLIKKAEETGFDFSAHEKKIEALEASIQSSESSPPLQIDGVPTAKLALAGGPTSSAWENGRILAVYSLFFAFPWIYLYFDDLIVNPNLSRPYLILNFLQLGVSFLVQWTLYGFFFGYFFPQLRGSNGLQKGLSYFLALAVPQAAITFFFIPLNLRTWEGFSIFVLQLFIQTMLLGLVAGDYESLRRARLGWLQLFEIHRFTALASWASTTTLAIGAAVTTLLASNVGELIMAAFEIMRMAGPELPPPGG